MKRPISLIVFALAVGPLFAAWTVAPSPSVTLGSNVSASVSANANMGYGLSYLVIWRQNPGGTWSYVDVETGANGAALNAATGDLALNTAGTWTWEASLATTPPGSSPTGLTLVAGPSTTVVTIPTTPTTFALRVNSFTYNGGTQGPIIDPTPTEATFTSGGTLSAVAAGNYTATATAYGSYSGSNSNLTWSITQAPQSINFPNPGTQTYGTSPTLSATASSGLPVSFSVVSGPATLAGNTLTFTGAGGVTVQANQGGNGNYSAAAPVNQSFTVSPQNQSTVSLTPGSQSVSVGATLNFTASGGGVGGYAWGGTAGASGSGATKSVTFNSVGSFTVTAYSPGDANTNASNTASVTITVNPLATTFALNQATFTYTGSAQGPSIVPAPVGATFTPGGTLSATVVGNYTATATAYGNYTGTNNSLSWSITKADQGTVSLTPGSQSVSVGATLNFTASGGGVGGYVWGGTSGASGSGTTKSVTFNTVGSYTVTAYSPGDGNTNTSNTASVTITVNPLATTFALNQATFTYSGSAQGPSIVPTPAGATFTSGGTLSAAAVGSYTATATAYGNYTGSNNSLSWSITKADQTTVALTPGSQSVSVGATLNFTASGGGVGGYVWGGTSGASGSGATKSVTFNTVGSYTVTAYSPGDGNTNASNTASVTISVNPLATTFALNQATFTYSGSAQGPSIVPTPAGATFTPGGTLSATVVGSYTATATAYGNYTGTNNSLSWSITKADQTTVALTPGSQSVSVGATLNFTASGGGVGGYVWGGTSGASGSGATKSVTFNTVGSYTVTAYSPGDANTNASNTASVTITVNPLATTFALNQATFTYTGSAQGPSIVPTPAGATFTPGGTLSATVVGSYTATATAYGNYTGSNNSLSWSIGKANQTISFPNPGTQTVGTPLTLSASASSGLAVSFAVINGTASLAGNVVTFTTAGSVTITASQAGNTNYNAATDVPQTFTVNAVVVAPAITAQPANSTVTAGQSATFTIAASGTAPLSYQWQRMPNGSSTWSNLTEGGSYSNVATATLTVSATTTGMSGDQFRCTVTNTAGNATSNAATLTVNAAAVAPTITTQPTNQTVTAPQSATFTIAASGTAPLSYQWQRMPNGSSTWSSLTEGGSYSNVATATLTVSATTTGMSGDQFRCTVTNTAGNATSNAATLTVNAANTSPTISDIPNHSINEDGNTGAVAFTVGDAETAAGSLAVSGTSSNTTLVPNSNIVCGGSGANRTVTVTPAANLSGTATITVTVSDGSLIATDTFLLTVTAINDAPTISDITDRAISMNGTTGAVACTVGDVETTAGSLMLSGTSSDTTLVPNANIVFGGSGASRTVTVTPAPSQSGTATISITVSDGGLTATDTFVLTVTAGNTAPTISNITDRTINEDANTGAVAFTVGDAQTAAANLTLSGTSSNTTLVPTANIVFGGSGASRTVRVTPAANQNGTVTISVTVSDGTLSATDTFVLTVTAISDAPTISNISNRTINEDGNTGAVAFTVGDAETAVGSLTVSGTSSNTALVPTANIVFGGSGASRTVTVTPLANQNGTATITVTVSDGSLTASDPFVLTVTAVNDTPTISDITNRTINEDSNTGAVAFTVGDIETAAGSLTVTGTSSNTTRVPNANIVFGGSGENRTVTVTPAANQTGTATITVTVSDGSRTKTDTFVLTITAVNDTPTISDITDRTINTNGNTGAVAFTVGDVETAASSLTVNKASSNTTLVPTANIVFGGSGASRTVTVTPATSQSGTATITVTVSDGSLTATDTFVLTVTPANTPPTISDITDRTINEDGNTGAVAFTVGDAQTAAGSLAVSGTSSNTTLVPNANIVCGGSDSSRTVTVTPAANQSGTATITVTVSDGSLTATDTFVLTVTGINDPPTITDITDRTIDEDGTTGAVAFTVGDAETPAASLMVSGTSSNTTLVPNANIVLGGSGASRTITVTPAANQSGTATITVTVSDGSLTATDTFVLTVTGINDAPTVSDIDDRTIPEDGTTGPIPFTVGDTETAAGSLAVSGTSSNTTLVPNTNIVFGGSGASRTVTVTPAPNQNGAAIITVTVSDGSATRTDTFVLTVTSVNDAPTISSLTDRTINANSSTGPVAFTVDDIETPAGSLTVTFTSSSNLTLVSSANIVFGGSGANRTVTVTPAPDQYGSATITISVSDGVSTTPSSFVLNVTTPNQAPVVSLTAPAANTVFTLPVTIILTATASDSDGTVAKVEFYANSAKIGEDLTAPYSFSWTPERPGWVVLKARATDNLGMTADSAEVGIEILPSVPYTVDFESSEGFTLGSVHGQLGWDVTAGAARVVDTAPAHGTQSVVLDPGATAAQITQLFGPASPNPPVVFIDKMVKPFAGVDQNSGSSITAESSQAAFVHSGTYATYGDLSGFDDNGGGPGVWRTISYAFVALDANAVATAWHRLTFRIDFTAKTYDLYLDGKLLTYDLHFRTSSATFLSSLQFKGSTGFATYIDDLFVGADNPLFGDVNNDGIDDAWETAHGLSLASNQRNGDPDGDGRSNIQEFLDGTDPMSYFTGTVYRLPTPSTAGDGLPDAWKLQYGLDPAINYSADPYYSVYRFAYQNNLSPAAALAAHAAGAPGGYQLVLRTGPITAATYYGVDTSTWAITPATAPVPAP